MELEKKAEIHPSQDEGGSKKPILKKCQRRSPRKLRDSSGPLKGIEEETGVNGRSTGRPKEKEAGVRLRTASILTDANAGGSSKLIEKMNHPVAQCKLKK